MPVKYQRRVRASMRDFILRRELISDLDWARLAAYVDGEGCISIKHKKARGNKGLQHGIYLNVINTDARLVLWCLNTFGGNVHSLNYRNSEWGHKPWKASFRWEAYGPIAVEILRKCYPFFILKREQADLVFALHKTIVEQPRGFGVCVSHETRAYRESLKVKLHELKKVEHTLKSLEEANA